MQERDIPQAKKRSRFVFLSRLPKWLLVSLLPFWTCGAFYFTQIVVAVIFHLIFSESFIRSPAAQSIYTIVADLIAIPVVIIVPYLCVRSWRSDRNELGLAGLPTWSDLAIAPIAYLVYLILSNFCFQIFTKFSWFNPSENQDIGLNFGLLFGPSKVITLISLVVIVPIVEELVFRGFLYGKIKKYLHFRFEILAIILNAVITSFAFAIIHGQWNVGVDVFALSMILCFLREITGSIYPGIIVHMLKNALAFFVLISSFGH